MPEDSAAGTVVLGASQPGVMPRNWGPMVRSLQPLSAGLARRWVEQASLPPAVTRRLADVIGLRKLCLTVGPGGQGLVWLIPLIQPLSHVLRSSAPFSKLWGVFLPYLLAPMQTSRQAVSPGPSSGGEGKRDLVAHLLCAGGQSSTPCFCRPVSGHPRA